MKTALFFTGFIQVYFVAINTYFLAKEVYIGVIVASFMISIIWSFNVKKIAFGSIKDRIIYSIGAMIGSVLGLYQSSKIIELINKL
jgi:hypothetical protein